MPEHLFDTLRILLALFKTNYELEILFNLIYKDEIKKKIITEIKTTQRIKKCFYKRH
jgi:hypothetical protein